MNEHSRLPDEPESSPQHPAETAATAANEGGAQQSLDSASTTPSAANAAIEPSPTAAATAKAASHTESVMSSETSSAPSNPAAAPVPAVAPVVIKQSSGKGIALGALVLSMLALGASGFLFVQGQNALKSMDTIWAQKINDAGLGQSKNSSLLQENLTKQAELQNQLALLGKTQQEQQADLGNVNRAYQELTQTRFQWLVDETEYTLNLATQQLLLSGNASATITALENIESRLSQFDRADLLPIKQAVSTDLAALKNRPYVDVAAASLRLDRLESAVPSMPLVLDSVLKPTAVDAAPVTPEANLSWWQKMWQETKNNFRGLVEVRKLENKDAMLLAPDQAYFVRENIRLRLLDARVALMQRQGEVYVTDLDNVEAAVRQYFDLKAPATVAWLNELTQLKALSLQANQANALQNSLAAVRDYQAKNSAMQAPLPNASASAIAVPATPVNPPNAGASAAVPTKPADKAASGTQEGRVL